MPSRIHIELASRSYWSLRTIRIAVRGPAIEAVPYRRGGRPARGVPRSSSGQDIRRAAVAFLVGIASDEPQVGAVTDVDSELAAPAVREKPPLWVPLTMSSKLPSRSLVTPRDATHAWQAHR